ncbi:MAG: hypothetical protein ACLP29_02075 [Dissulfurispiraceae bacterium]
MREVTINKEEKLFVIPAGDEGYSYLGFDNLYKRLKALEPNKSFPLVVNGITVGVYVGKRKPTQKAVDIVYALASASFLSDGGKTPNRQGNRPFDVKSGDVAGVCVGPKKPAHRLVDRAAAFFTGIKGNS